MLLMTTLQNNIVQKVITLLNRLNNQVRFYQMLKIIKRFRLLMNMKLQKTLLHLHQIQNQPISLIQIQLKIHLHQQQTKINLLLRKTRLQLIQNQTITNQQLINQQTARKLQQQLNQVQLL